MSVNKNALLRYNVLDRCFSNTRRKYFIHDLIAECNKALQELDSGAGGISRRQIYDDISFMESIEGWAIELEKKREGKKVYYQYADRNFSITKMPLNETEIQHLKSAIEVLSQFKGMPQFEWIYEIESKLLSGIKQSNKQTTLIEFDNNKYLQGIDKLGMLYEAIYSKSVLSIKYQPFKSTQEQLLTIHPYYLKQYNNRWFLFGYNPEYKISSWNLALDRIVTIEFSNLAYIENTEINWQEYFEDMVGVTKPPLSKPEHIVLLFKEGSGKYIETKPIHGSQKSKWIDNDTLEVSLQLIVNYEFEQILLAQADVMIIKSPAHLRDRIKDRLLKGYNNQQGLQ